MANVITVLPGALPVPANAGGVSAAVDVRAAGGPLTFTLNGNDGDVIRVQGSPDGLALWGDVLVLSNGNASQTPAGAVFGFIRLVRDRIDPSPGVVLVVPQVSITAQPLPSGYSFVTAAIPVPAGDGVGAAVNLQASGLTDEIQKGSAKSIVCSAFDLGDNLTLENSADGNAPWATLMQLQQGKILSLAGAIGFCRIRRARVPAAGPRVGVDGATAAFMGQGVISGGAGSGQDVRTFGAKGDGVTDDTAAFQAALTAALVAGQALVVPPGNYLCNQINDTTAARLEIVGSDGANILATSATWLKVTAPAGTGKTNGVRITNLRITAQANQQAMTPLVWLEGAATGGITSVDISDVTFFGGGTQLAPLFFDCIWLRGCFNGKLERIWGWSLWGSRGIVYDDNNIQSGNFHFDTITLADAAIAIVMIGRGGTGFLENVCTNVKCVRGAAPGDAAAYNPRTLTAGAAINDATLTVSLADAAAVAAHLAAGDPQWAICADINNVDQPIRITAANGGTGVLTLAKPVSAVMANGTVFGVGSFGIVIMGNARANTIVVPHFEQVGCGLYCSTAQGVKVLVPLAGANVKRGFVATNGTQHLKFIMPTYQPANAGLTLAEVTAQGTNAWNSLYEAVASGGGSSAVVWSNAGGVTNQSLNDQSGAVGSSVTMDGLAAVNTPGHALQNTVAATAGVPVQMSPGLLLSGFAWDTGALASKSSRYLVVNLPSSANPPTSQFAIYSSDNGGAFTLRAFVSNSGIISLSGVFAGGGTGTGTFSGANLEPAGSAAQTIGSSANSTGVSVGRTAVASTLAGGQKVKRTTVADAPYTAVAGDYIIGYTSLSAGRAVTLPVVANTIWVIKNESAGAFALTIAGASGTIDGAASVATAAAAHAAAIRVYCDGTNFHTM